MEYVKAIQNKTTGDNWQGVIMHGRYIEWRCMCSGFHADKREAIECAKAMLYKMASVD